MRFIDKLTSAQRKEFPMATGLIDYAPDALAAVAHISWVGNNKHNPGQPLHHARGKSMDHADCEVRHLSTRHDVDPAYKDDIIAPVFHMAEKAWRAIMELQEAMERVYDLPLAPAARPAPTMHNPALTADYVPQRCPEIDTYGTGLRCALQLGHEGDHTLEAPAPAPLCTCGIPDDSQPSRVDPDCPTHKADVTMTRAPVARGAQVIAVEAALAVAEGDGFELTPSEERAIALRVHQSSAECSAPAECSTCNAMKAHALDE